jgi:SNF2 family DNA or RNA helicase
VDELANFKNEKALRTKRLTALRGMLNFGLTATVVENSIDELFTMLHFVAPGFMSRKQFVSNHVMYNQYGGVDGFYNLKAFRRKAKPYIYEVTRAKDSISADKVKLKHEVVLIPSKVYAKARLGKLLDNLQSMAKLSDGMDSATDYSELAHYQFRHEIHKKNVRKMIGAMRKFLSDPDRGGKPKFKFLRKLIWSWVTTLRHVKRCRHSSPVFWVRMLSGYT